MFGFFFIYLFFLYELINNTAKNKLRKHSMTKISPPTVEWNKNHFGQLAPSATYSAFPRPALTSSVWATELHTIHYLWLWWQFRQRRRHFRDPSGSSCRRCHRQDSLQHSQPPQNAGKRSRDRTVRKAWSHSCYWGYCLTLETCGLGKAPSQTSIRKKQQCWEKMSASLQILLTETNLQAVEGQRSTTPTP